VANNSKFLTLTDEIDLVKLLKILIETKRIVFISILFFFILSIFYLISQKNEYVSSSSIEIGFYDHPDSNSKLIETPRSLISELELTILRNTNNQFNQVVKMETIMDRVVVFKTKSDSIERNKEILVKFTDYVKNRHKKLYKNNSEKELNQIEAEINILKSTILDLETDIALQNKFSRVKVMANLELLQNDLPIIEKEIAQLEQAIIDDENNLNLLKQNPDRRLLRAGTSPTIEQIISMNKTQINLMEREKNINIKSIKSLNGELEVIRTKNYNPQLASYKRSLIQLENELELQSSEIFNESQTIGTINTEVIKPNAKLIISFSLLIGLFIGMIFAFILNLKKIRI
jgi:hypothetical protein